MVSFLPTLIFLNSLWLFPFFSRKKVIIKQKRQSRWFYLKYVWMLCVNRKTYVHVCQKYNMVCHRILMCKLILLIINNILLEWPWFLLYGVEFRSEKMDIKFVLIILYYSRLGVRRPKHSAVNLISLVLVLVLVLHFNFDQQKQPKQVWKVQASPE